jgi:LAO/AO transport system kinase
VLQGDQLSLASTITQVENDTQLGHQVLDQLFSHGGTAHLIGITGPSGAGKSTLVNALVRRYREQMPEKKVAVIGVDPTSPFSGGALLGDRVRMRDICADPGVFMRSMATRGALGGLAKTTAAVVAILDAGGYDPILVETVGAGQAEVDIARLAHTTIVIEAPGLGDDVQSSKAGILEIADILVVNKSDHPGAEGVVQSLRSMIEMGTVDRGEQTQQTEPDQWIPPVISTIATQGQGIIELMEAISQHAEIIHQNGDYQRKENARMQAWVQQIFQEELMKNWQQADSYHNYAKIIQEVTERKLSPYRAVQQLLKQ